AGRLEGDGQDEWFVAVGTPRKGLMMEFKLWHAFVLGAVLSWGVYVPVLHEGQVNMGGDRETRSLRGFLCVGVAYFLTAVGVPFILVVAGGGKFGVSGL